MVDDFPKYNLPTVLKSTKDLDAVMDAIKDHVIPALKLWEYKVLDVTAEKKKLKEALTSANPNSESSAFEGTTTARLTLTEQAKLLAEHGIADSQSGTRYGRTVDMAVAVAFIKNLGGIAGNTGISEQEAERLVDAYGKVLDEYNLPLYKEYDEDVRIALENTRNRIEYTRLADHGPKWGEVTKRLVSWCECCLYIMYVCQVVNHYLASFAVNLLSMHTLLDFPRMQRPMATLKAVWRSLTMVGYGTQTQCKISLDLSRHLIFAAKSFVGVTVSSSAMALALMTTRICGNI